MVMIHVEFRKSGIHCYPDAPEEVAFLRSPHFHYFYFKVDVEVKHDNREIEFILFQKWCEKLYADNTLQLDNKSCEMIAKDLINKITEEYGERRIRVSVLEDNINGAIVDNWN